MTGASMLGERVRERPAVGAPRRWEFPLPQVHELPNGMRLLLVDVPGQHVLSLRVGLRLPVAGETPGTEGATLLMARALDEGTARRSAEEMAVLIERHGIAWGTGVGERGVHLGCEVTARHLRTSLEIVREVLAEAAFPDAEVARIVRHRLADIAHELAEPGARASLELRSAYFDAGDRASRPLGGTRDSVAALTAQDLRDRHARLTPHRGTVVLTGDLSTVPDPAGEVAAVLGSWNGAGTAAEDPAPGVRSAEAGRVVLVARPGLAQTEVYLGRPGPDRRTEHGWGTYQALAMALGGSPHARIDRVLREERGYTYGIRAGFRPRSSGGLTVVGGSVRADATVPALQELVQILERSDLTEQEVRRAADFVTMTAPGRYATADAVADELISLADDGLDPGTVTRTLDHLRVLTADQVVRAWQEVLEGPGWTTVLVGDPDHAEGVDGLGLGPVTVIP